MLKPLVPKFRPDLLVHLKHIAEKQVPAKLNPIVACSFHAFLVIRAPFMSGVGKGRNIMKGKE